MVQSGSRPQHRKSQSAILNHARRAKRMHEVTEGSTLRGLALRPEFRLKARSPSIGPPGTGDDKSRGKQSSSCRASRLRQTRPTLRSHPTLGAPSPQASARRPGTDERTYALTGCCGSAAKSISGRPRPKAAACTQLMRSQSGLSTRASCVTTCSATTSSTPSNGRGSRSTRCGRSTGTTPRSSR